MVYHMRETARKKGEENTHEKANRIHRRNEKHGECMGEGTKRENKNHQLAVFNSGCTSKIASPISIFSNLTGH